MKSTWIRPLVLCLASIASSVAQAKDACSTVRARGAPVIIPFSVIDGRIYVQANVDGRGPFRFAVDTGASGVGRLDASLLPMLDKRATGRAATSDGVATAEVESTHVDSLSVGPVERKGLELITRDYRKHVSANSAFDGIIGRAFFADGLLIIDYGRHEILFTQSDSLVHSDVGVLPYERAFRVPIKIAGKPFVANLDTGANVALVVPKSLWPAVSSAPISEAASSQLTNGTITTFAGTVAGPLTAGGVSWSNLEAKVSDRFQEILIGARALSSSILGIDQRSQSIAICPI